MAFVFVGEKPSQKAFDNNWTWSSGRLAAKTLFNALKEVGISPDDCKFFNIFGDHPDDLEIEIDERISNISKMIEGNEVLAMGQKVHRILLKAGIPHKVIQHPAARGKMRATKLYIEHVGAILNG